MSLIITFSNISGSVGVTAVYDRPVTERQHSPYVSIDRKYFVNGVEVTSVSENDFVEVRLYPRIDQSSLDGRYNVVDILPSGLKTISRPYRSGFVKYYSRCMVYPYEISGNIVKFSTYKSDPCKYFKYYARVINPGVFKAESAIIQYDKAPGLMNYSSESMLRINRVGE